MTSSSAGKPKPEPQKTAQEAGDPAEWPAKHGDYLFRFGLLYLRNRDTVEDLVQETLLAGVRAIESFEGRSSIRTWLRGILKNKIIDHLRKEKRERAVSYDEAENPNDEQTFNRLGLWRDVVPAWSADPESRLGNMELKKALLECLDKLPQRLKTVFSLRIIDDVDNEDLCKELGISTSNAWVLLYRARMNLRDCLERNWFQKGR